MKKFFLSFTFLILLILGGFATFVIHSFNTDNFKEQIITSVKNVTGRDFTVLGEAEVSWFPTPKIILNDIKLTNIAGSTRSFMLDAERVTIHIDWSAFFSSPLIIKRINVTKPHLYLEKNMANKVNWDFPFFNQEENYGDDPLRNNQKFIQTQIDSLQIKQGHIEYINAPAEAKAQITEISGNLSLGSLQGPYVFEGEFSYKDKNFNADLNVDQYSSTAPTPFKANIIENDQSIVLELTGEITPSRNTSSAISLAGTFSVKHPNDILALFDLKPLSAALNIPSTGSLDYKIDDKTIALDKLAIRFGPSDDSVALIAHLSRQITGSLPIYDASLTINTFDYNHWEDIIKTIKTSDLYDPKTPEFKLKLNFAKALYGTQTAKDITLDISKKQDRFFIDSFKALLPGETSIQAEGSTLTKNHETGLLINVSASSKDFKQALFAYLDVQHINPELLKEASLKGVVTLWDDKTAVDIEELTLAKASVKGSATIQDFDKKPTIQSKLTLNNINCDEYTNYQKSDSDIEILSLPQLVKSTLQNATIFQKANADVNLDLSDIVWHQIPVKKGHIEAKLTDGVLDIKTIKLQDTASADISATAKINNIGSKEASIDSLKADISTKAFNTFMKQTHFATQNKWFQNVAQANFNIQVSEKDNVWQTTLKNSIASLESTINGTLSFKDEKPQAQELTINMRYPSFKSFLKDVLNIENADTTADGAFEVKSILNGNQDDLSFKDTILQIGVNKFNISGKKTIVNNKPFIEATIDTTSIDLDKYLPASLRHFTQTGAKGGQPFDFKELKDHQGKITLTTKQLLLKDKELHQVKMSASLQNNTLQLEDFIASIDENENPTIHASGKLVFEEKPILSANVHFDETPLPEHFITGNKFSFGNGAYEFEANLSANGSSPNELRENLTGKGSLSLKETLFVGADLNRISGLITQTIKDKETKSYFDTVLTRALNSGKTNISSVSGSFIVEKGVIKMPDLSLKADTVFSSPMQVTYDITNSDLNVSVPLSVEEYPDLPPFALTLKGPFDKPQYYQNSVDLSNGVADLIERDNIKQAKEKQKEQEDQARMTLTKRQERTQEAITQARQAVDDAQSNLLNNDNTSANFLLQNSKDALEIVNKLSIKESLTDAEYIQLMEQSRLCVLKANEAVAEAQKDKYFEDKRQLTVFVKNAHDMRSQVEFVHETNPDIEIVGKLSSAMTNYIKKLEEAIKEMSKKTTADEHERIMQEARDNYQKIIKAYNYASRFNADMQQVSFQVPDVPVQPKQKIKTVEPKEIVETPVNASTPDISQENDININQTDSASTLKGSIQRRRPQL